jgi:hypothetical protein
VTRAYVEEHPSIRDALGADLVNYALLARKIQQERGLRNEEAVEIALRRFQQEISLETPARAAVREILQESRLEVRGRVALLRIKEDWALMDRLYQIGRGLVPELRRRGVFQMFQSTRALTVLCEDDLLGQLLEAVPEDRVLAVERGLASVAFRSAPNVEQVPGVLAAMAEALFQHGINCLETVSVHTDSIFVFKEKDVIRGYAALSSLLGPAPETTGPEGLPSLFGRAHGPRGVGRD